MALFGNKNQNASGETEMGFFDHIEVLRWHILRSVLAILVGGIVFFIYKEFTFDTLVLGPMKKDFPTYRFLCWMGEITCMQPADITLSTRELGEMFFVHFKVAFWMGLISAFPFVLWEVWRFVKPGLYENEKNVTRGVVFICTFLFYSGVAFGYYVIAPFAVTWLGNYTVGGNTIIQQPTLASYVSYITMFTIPTGLVFELPLGAYFLGKLGVLTSSFLRNYRRHAIVVIFIIAAIVTPPDIVTQILISMPILILYEVSIIIVRRIEKNNTMELAKFENNE
jgi:sec-independent protein translocase protein TatC